MSIVIVSPVTTDANVCTGIKHGAFLTNENAACGDNLIAEALHAAHFWI
jgi:hypothetical protein